MILKLAHVALLVRDYDEALAFYCQKLGFSIVEDTQLTQGKRWVRIALSGQGGSEILLSRATDDRQRAMVGNQTAGRVLFFLYSDNFFSDYESLISSGVEFVEGPSDQSYGRVAVFKDLYGNRIDLIEPTRN